MPDITPLFPLLAQHPALPWAYAGFIALILAFLALDLGVFHRTAHTVSIREAAAWSAVWTACALAFTIFVYLAYEAHWLGLGLEVPIVGHPDRTAILTGADAAEQYLTGYIIEWSLSIDNLFVIAVIFSYFAIPAKYQHRVLFWGILGALVMRGIMIAVGAALIQRFGWVTYLFGGFLILTAGKMALAGDEPIHPDRNILIRFLRRVWPIAPHCDGQHFFTTIPGPTGALCRAATPLLPALLAVEFTDLVFALDSVPAIFAVTGDPFIVLTSNVFAIMGLRSLYFLLANMLERLRFLKPALVAILLFVGVKMLLVHTEYKVSTPHSLIVVAGLLAAGIVASLLIPPRHPVPEQPPHE